MATGEALLEMLMSVEEADGVTLSPVERLLLATDGTVTHMLEALTRGPVNVEILSRDVSGGVLDRKVVLTREQDGSRLVWAESDIYLRPLPATLEDALVAGDIGIGHLLSRKYAETRREIIAMDVARPADPAFPAFIDGAAPLYLTRTYRIYAAGNRLMEIREFFPKGLF